MAIEVAIIGAGPAGMATALQLKRSGIEPLLLERERVGGLLLNANLVENYLGFPQGVPSEELVQLFAEQLKALDVEVHVEEVLRLDHDGQVFIIHTSKRRLSSKVVVLASGTKSKEFTDCTIPQGAKERILYEAYPLRKAQNKRIVIVGAGDAAFDYALNLAKRNEVIILNRGELVSCLPLLWERAKTTPRIVCQASTVITGIAESAKGLLLDLAAPGQRWSLQADYVILAIGRIPQLDFLSEGLRKRVKQLQAEGSLYLVGDVRRGIYRQTAIAAGDGIEAAMRIYRRRKEAER